MCVPVSSHSHVNVDDMIGQLYVGGLQGSDGTDCSSEFQSSFIGGLVVVIYSASLQILSWDYPRRFKKKKIILC